VLKVIEVLAESLGRWRRTRGHQGMWNSSRHQVYLHQKFWSASRQRQDYQLPNQRQGIVPDRL